MSGPKTLLLNPALIPVLLAAAGINAAQALHEGYAHAEELRRQHEADRDERASTQRALAIEASSVAEADVARSEDRLAALLRLASSLGIVDMVRAAAPTRRGEDAASTFAYVAGITAYANEIEVILLNETARLEKDLDGDVRMIDVALTSELHHIASSTGERLLRRIAHLGRPPDEIALVAQELDLTAPGDRATMLASELRLRIQNYLNLVQERMLQEATSTVIQQSLRDLGYVVEDIPNTLFVEGGLVHFKRRDWGDYMIRMRLSGKDRSANFNVVRGIDQGMGEPSVMDHIAEDRWCSEFPNLLQALEARGVGLQVTRHLAAGELPVQLVDRQKLPTFADDEDVLTSVLRARELK